jgi:HEAT repeat protein
MDHDAPNHDRPASDLHSPPPLAGEDHLPEVEPPSARFIIQLFVVPALIVTIVFSIWLLFSWLVHRTTMNPDQLIQGLQSSNVARWQRAMELADLLRDERYADFRQDTTAAGKLATILDRELDNVQSGGETDEKAEKLRFFLCRALGEFRVNEGLDVLLKAAATNRSPGDQFVRRGAIQAIAVRASILAQLDPPQALSDPNLESTLQSLSRDEDELIRSETAYALGRIGTPAALALLETMVDDPHADTRYNAAVGLAQHGNALAADTLAEMLDPDEMASVSEEQYEAAQFFKRGLIMTSALEAVETLAEQTPTADFSAVIESLERLVSADADQLREAQIRSAVVLRARQVLAHLQGLAREAEVAKPSP